MLVVDRVMAGSEGRPWAGSLRLQTVQVDLWERRLPDAAEDGLEGGRGTRLWGTGH